MPHKWNSEPLKDRVVRAFTLAVPTFLVIMGGSWTADLIKEGVEAGWCFDRWFLLVSLALLIIGANWLYRQRSKFLPIHTFTGARAPEAHKVLMLLVSMPRQKIQLVRETLTLTATEKCGNCGDHKVSDTIQLPNSLTDAINALDNLQTGRFNWQQLLRALCPHKDVLEKVVLIGSDDGTGRGSFPLLGTCADLIQMMLPNVEIIQARSVHFEWLPAVRELIEQHAQQLTGRSSGYGEQDILVDVTGGQKTSSIGAAMATLRFKDVSFQYVPEGGNEPILFNVMTLSPIS